MTGWPLIAARLALYGDLGLLFGLPLFTLYARSALTPRGTAGLFAALSAGGLLLAPLGFALLVAQMGGTTLGQLDPALAWTLLGQTAVGAAFALRMAALLLALVLALFLPSRRGMSWSLMLCGGLALATLAWSGHGAANEGMAGLLHLGADIVHLLAAAAWIGALVMLLMLVAPRGPVTHQRVAAAHAALSGFSTIGTIIVALIAATGIANLLFIVGLAGIPALPGSPYGQLLLLKLLAFIAMLGCAGLNRFRLTPRLAAAQSAESAADALASLRRSIAIEALLAALAIALVAWLGTLQPPG